MKKDNSKKILRNGLLLFSTLVFQITFGQEIKTDTSPPQIETDTVKVFEHEYITGGVKEAYPTFKLGGVFQARYLNNFKNNVDVNGLQHIDGSGTNNTFDIKRMRISLNVKVSQDLEVVVLTNFADFKSDPKTKVLENAYARYSLNRYAQITIGQFRPLFGREETYSVDIIKSIDYSNSYYLFGPLGWTSFQIGGAITGNVDIGSKMGLNYGFSVVNGNGKNKIDNDDGKNYSSRILLDIDKSRGFSIGISGGIAEVEKQKSHAYGVEAALTIPLANKWSVDFQTEAKRATNHTLFFGTAPINRLGELNDYIVNSFYILPNIRYEVGLKRLQAIEFACRYEILDENSKLDSNPRQTWVPILSFEFIKDYKARLQIGMQIDNYKHNFENTTKYNSNLAFVQLQCRL